MGQRTQVSMTSPPIPRAPPWRNKQIRQTQCRIKVLHLAPTVPGFEAILVTCYWNSSANLHKKKQKKRSFYHPFYPYIARMMLYTRLSLLLHTATNELYDRRPRKEAMGQTYLLRSPSSGQLSSLVHSEPHRPWLTLLY